MLAAADVAYAQWAKQNEICSPTGNNMLLLLLMLMMMRMKATSSDQQRLLLLINQTKHRKLAPAFGSFRAPAS